MAGQTFRYTEKGPEGLAGGKQVIVASSRGGFYGPDTSAAFLDHQESYLRGIFGFFGIGDVKFIRAEGLALVPISEQKRSRLRRRRSPSSWLKGRLEPQVSAGTGSAATSRVSVSSVPRSNLPSARAGRKWSWNDRKTMSVHWSRRPLTSML